MEERFASERAPLLAYLRRLTAGVPTLDPDDMVQETLERAWRARHGYDESRPLGAWLRGIGLRIVIDAARGRGARVTPLEAEPIGAEEGQAQMEAREEVERLLSRLDPVEAELLDRFHRRGETIAELAQAKGHPEGTIKSWLSRARRKLLEGGR